MYIYIYIEQRLGRSLSVVESSNIGEVYYMKREWSWKYVARKVKEKGYGSGGGGG